MVTPELQIPDALEDARASGNLVIFAGAGVSMGPPTLLPSFYGLAKEIAGSDPKEPFDRFLGDIKKERGTDVHQRTEEILRRRRKAQPNALHFEILRLFYPDRGRTARIVTTNFDKQFSKAAKHLHLNLREYYAPALPRGDEFQGIVHIHGALGEKPETMVLTDFDFGRAYLLEGWARIFLEALFQKYTTLFVGYSHQDTLMTYLSRGMSGRGLMPRFALCPTAEKSWWRRFQIEPVHYAKKLGPTPHARLVSGMKQWSKDCNLTLFQFEKEVRKAIETPFGRLPSARNAFFLRLALRKKHTAEFFARHAVEWRWVGWAQKAGFLGRYFSRNAPIADDDAPTIRWVARQLVQRDPNPANENRGVRLVHENGGNLSPQLFADLAREICSLSAEDLNSNNVTQLILLLVSEAQAMPLFPVFPVSWLMDSVAKAKNCHLAEHILFALAAPRIGFHDQFLPTKMSPFGSPTSRVEPKMVGESSQIKAAWEKHFVPTLDLRGRGLLPVFETFVRQVHFAHAAVATEASRTSDALSWQLEDLCRAGDEIDIRDLGILVGMLRDSALAVARSKEGMDRAQVVAWLRSGIPILFRLGILALANSTSLSAYEKTTIFLKEGCLYSPVANARAEEFGFLKEVYPRLNRSARSVLWKAILKGASNEALAEYEEPAAKRRARQRQIDHTVAHMVETFPADASSKLEARRREVNEPKWKKRIADERAWGIPRTITGSPSPFTVDDLLKKDPAKDLTELIEFKQTDFLGPSREGLQASVGASVKKDLVWGEKLISALVTRKAWESDLWRGIFWANDWVSWPQNLRGQMLELIKHHFLTGPRLNDASFFLFSGEQWKNGPIPHGEELEALLELCINAWKVAEETTLPARESAPEQVDWTFQSLNSAPGRIAEFTLRYAKEHLHRKPPKRRRAELPPRVEQLLDAMVASESYAGSLALARIGLESRFLLHASEIWFKKRIAPLFDTKVAPEKFWPLYHSMIGYSAASKQMLEVVANGMVGLFPVISKRDDRLFDNFCNWVGLAVWFFPDKYGGKQFLYEFMGKLSEKQVVHWGRAMGRLQFDIPEDRRDDWWRRWVRKYWADRLSGHPVAFKPAEATVMVQWALAQNRYLSEAVAFVERTKSFAEPTGFLFYEIAKSKHPELRSLPTARLILFLLKKAKFLSGAEEEIHSSLRRMPKTIPKLKPFLNKICEQLLRLGDKGANDLLAELTK